jgi:hypothetical protein
MSRPSPALLAIAALTLLALPAAAQVPNPGGSLAIQGLAGALTSNQTQAVVPFTVQVSLNQGTCVGGSGQFQVQLSATKTGNASVEVQPATLTFQVPQTQTLAGGYTSTGGAVLVVKPGLVRSNVTIPVTVKATASVGCSVPGAGMGASGLSAEGSSTVKFVPVSQEVADGPTQTMPGLGIPALLAVVGLALLAQRRRTA